MADDLHWQPATVLAQRLIRREVSARDVMASFLDRIDRINPRVNAIVSLRDRDVLMAEAAAADEQRPNGALHGMPVAIKDLVDVAGLPTRSGSLLTSNDPVTKDDLFVSRMRQAGAIFIGKTNTPEHGAGSHTFNEVFGVTRNPHNLEHSAGGSSGGGAAALASGMLAIADGSDLGGSLRNPAAWNGVVGMRPSIGRVPTVPTDSGFINDLAVTGPMARSVEDLSLLLSVQAGPDPRVPRCLETPGPDFRAVRDGDLEGIRVAWGGAMGLTYQADAYSVPLASMSRFEAAGATVTEATPDLAGAMEVFRVFRGLIYREVGATMTRDQWMSMKETLSGNIAYGFDLTVDDIMAAEARRTAIHLEMARFFEHYDILAVPTTQVSPFTVDVEFPKEINGHVMTDYLHWMSSCCIISVTGCPAISMPCGFSDSGLPLGVQLIAPVGAEKKLLDIAQGFENATTDLRRRPVILPA